MINTHRKRDIKVEVVSATRLSEDDFWEKSALGRSLSCFGHDPCFVTRISFENTRGLSEVYNESIRAPHDHDILLFVHDDIWLNDYFLADRLVDALNIYDVVGLAGSLRRSARQTAWYASEGIVNFDNKYLSGVVGYGKEQFGSFTRYGPTPAECELLDGAFLAAKKSTLRDNAVFFDPRFDFHFYDMDFGRTARQKNLRLGTSQISIAHQSIGAFGSPTWHESCAVYLEKWGT
jgi:GT2 family glycosyltransferase